MTAPGEHQDDITTAKEKISEKVENASTQGNLQRQFGNGETALKSIPTGSHCDTQSANESVMSSFHDERRGSPVPSVMSMKSDQSMNHPNAFVGECTISLRVQLERPDSPRSLSSECTDDSPFCRDRPRLCGGVPCSVCPKKAFKSCLTCIASFCENHVKQHYTAPVLQRHKLVEAMADLEQNICQQHHRELELFCKTDSTPVCVLCVAREHSGHKITERGENESLQSDKTQVQSQREQGDPPAVQPQHKTDHLMSFLGKLGLLEFYPNKLTLRSLLEVSHATISDKKVETLKEVPLAFLRKLLMVNSKCRNLTSAYPKLQNNVDSDEDDEKCNPLDLVTALYFCADSFLQQEMSIKMSMCQFSVPFLLPLSGDNQCTLMVWALRNIYKEWCPHHLMHTKSYLEDSVVHAQIPLLSFVRLKGCKLSKSQLLNYVLSNPEQHISFFTHRDIKGGSVPKKISNGLVEIAWCLPCGQSNIDVFPEPVAIANMRGDIISNETQFSFLMKVSTAVFVFLDTMTQEEEKLLDFQGLLKSKLFLVVNSKMERHLVKSIDALKLQENHILRRKPQLNMEESSSLIISTINMSLKECKNIHTSEELSETALSLGISVDECKSKNSASAKIAADDIMKGVRVHQISDYKKKQMPLQGEYLKKISQIEIEECRLKKAGELSLEKYKDQLHERKRVLREQQANVKTSEAMEQFIQALSTDKEQRAFFLKWMALNIDRKSRNHFTELRRKFKEPFHGKDSNSIIELDQQLLNNSLGIEHYMREMGQIYESRQSDDTRHLPVIAAELLLDAYPLELLDGDASNIPEKWVTDVLLEVDRKVGSTRLLVVSVLGVQSTGKSTLLNTMFGVQFPVSSGRCTRGAYMLFLSVEQELREELKCDFVLLIDTEGLKAPELAMLEDSDEHDNQLATLLIGLSDVTIINIAMENLTEMKDVLQIAVHAFLRMKKLGKKPVCHFVHQNVSSVSAYSKLRAQREKLLEQLNKITKIAADMEKHSDVKEFTDMLHYDLEKNSWYIPGLWNGTPPMAPVNSGYSEAVHMFKEGLFESVKSTNLEHMTEIPHFLNWMSSLWKAVKYENFIFSFRNSLVAHAYDSLCKEFSGWEWSFRKSIYSWLNNAETQISNTDTSRVESLSGDLQSDAFKMIEDQTAKMNKNLKEYYKRKDIHVNLVERYRAEFEIDIKTLHQEITKIVENKLQSAVCLQMDIERVENIQKQHTDVIERQVVELLTNCKKLNTKLSDSDLEKEFEKMWSEVTRDVSSLKEKDISSCVMKKLRANLAHRSVQEELSKIGDLTRCGLEDFKVKSAHITEWKGVLNVFTRSIETDLQNIANNIIQSGERFIEGLVSTHMDYQEIFSKELLEKIDTGLKTEINGNTTFETDLKVHMCGIGARRFLEMHRHFLSDKDPRKHLDRSKNQYLSDFIDSYRQRDQCLRKAQDFTQLCIKPAVIEYINRSLGIEIVDEILSSKHSSQYSSRSYFQYTVLKELLEKNVFENFMRYIENYENFVKDWIHNQVVEWLSKDMGLVKLECHILKTIIQKIKEKIEIVQAEVNDPNDTEKATMFVENFCCALSEEITFPMNKVRGVLFQMSCRCTPFVESLVQSLDNLSKQLDKEFAKSSSTEDTLKVLTVKPQNEIFKRVFGCGEQCPFCKIPCEAGGRAHTQHHATVHRV
ncbi:interferon-induced very large GTPase 1-like [Alosa pseudoharengus]|uniref:interferon-induced very large GTPase 1-like n=1 Tax=Alosa pseudoharengus TaxID=34774 RepID=UPI003F8C77C5